MFFSVYSPPLTIYRWSIRLTISILKRSLRPLSGLQQGIYHLKIAIRLSFSIFKLVLLFNIYLFLLIIIGQHTRMCMRGKPFECGQRTQVTRTHYNFFIYILFLFSSSCIFWHDDIEDVIQTKRRFEETYASTVHLEQKRFECDQS